MELEAMLAAMLAEPAPATGAHEVEVRFGALVDGRFVAGVPHEARARLVERLRTYDGWTARTESFTRRAHYGAVLCDLDAPADAPATAKRRVRSATFVADAPGNLAVRACLSHEEPVAAPRPGRRAAETAVRAKWRESFEYKGKVRYDCTVCVTSVVAAGALAAPRATSEVELEATGEVSAASLALKVGDVAEIVCGARPAAYARVAAEG
jgi:hypothetical protein